MGWLGAAEPADSGGTPGTAGNLPGRVSQHGNNRDRDGELAPLRHLAGRSGHATLSNVDVASHEEYAVHVARLPLANRTRIHALDAVSLLWGHAPHLPGGVGVAMPPWEAEGLSHYLPTETGSNENLTPPIHPAVMSPLLLWALRFVEDFAADILAALSEHHRIKASIPNRHNPNAAGRLRDLLVKHSRSGTPTCATCSTPASRPITAPPPTKPHCASRTASYAVGSTTCAPSGTSTSRPPTHSPVHSMCRRSKTTSCGGQLARLRQRTSPTKLTPVS